MLTLYLQKDLHTLVSFMPLVGIIIENTLLVNFGLNIELPSQIATSLKLDEVKNL